ncbi:nucleotide pyrophosphohydrolase [Nesterenkonia aurantiaca]|uniref:nucleotide pyrophosphohydrolase n=1 Tax=Nesterenkonia aurantiaca TaxID=1436010 RepID=UPI003EE5129B
MSLSHVKGELRILVAEREWAQFHSPENLIKSIAIESGELLECVQWNNKVDPDLVRTELADVLTYAYLLADRMGWDPDEVVLDKLRLTRDKYPVEKSRGKSTKYDQL